MPCRDDGWNDPVPPRREPTTVVKNEDLQNMQKQIAFLEASLCAILRAHDTIHYPGKAYELINAIDPIESGVAARELTEWWNTHLVEDARRRENEKQNALNKLTPRERMILGL